MMNIVLIGYRGTGKTVVGKQLAEKLHKKLIATDELVAQKADLSIPELVERYGWRRFRDFERKVVEEISTLDNCIIDTGGGVILRKENVHDLKKNGLVILLKANMATIVNRIKKDTQRPSLTATRSFIEEVEDVLNQRKRKYEDAADYSIDTSKLTVNEVVNRILSHLKEKMG